MEDNKETKKSEVEVNGLGLIDVASEDDSLLFSSFLDPTGYEFSEADADKKCLDNEKDHSFLMDTKYCDEEILASSIEETEEVLQPRESPESQKVMDTKYCDEEILASSIKEKEDVLQPRESPEPQKKVMDTKHCDEEILVSSIQEKEEVLQPRESPEPQKVMDTEYFGEEIRVSSIEETEEVFQPLESPEPQKVIKSGKYNLRKSLAWDNAFFTSEGVLEPEELSSMMESNHKSERKALPTIEEDINRSTESISTFQSDCTLENNPEFVLFEDVRASIQRSAKASGGKKNELGATSPTPSTVDTLFSQEKIKPKAIPKKPIIIAQRLGKATKQPVAIRSLSTSISKPPNGLSRPLSSMSRASLDTSKTKQENNSKIPAGKEPLGPRISMSRSARPTLPKPAVRNSTLRSSVASKNELTSSCSSLESCASASSSASHKSSLASIKKKNETSSRLTSQSVVNRSTSRGSMGQPRISPHPTNNTSKSKLSSAGSISDSPSSRASATSKMAKGNQKTGSGEKCSSANDNTIPPIGKPLKNSKDPAFVQADNKEGMKRVSATNGGLVPPTSMKPSGLRVPLPKIGFFDGARNGSSSKKSGLSQSTRSPIQASSNS